MNLQKLLKDIDSFENAPKWVDKFRLKKKEEGALPFLIIYQAVGIMDKRDISKGGAIAIATRNLQRSGYLIEDSNRVSALGDIREIALLSRLGKRSADDYVRDFDRS